MTTNTNRRSGGGGPTPSAPLRGTLPPPLGAISAALRPWYGRGMKTSSFVASLVLVAGCSDSPEAKPVGSTSASSVAVSVSNASSAAAPSATAPAGASAKPGQKNAPPKAGASSKDKAALARHLTKGRKLSKDKDYKGAIAELDKALAISPKDAVVLAEVGWAALNVPDLERAKKANTVALANTNDPKLRAQILYNAGRVAEEQKDKDAARTLYGDSLMLRQNAEVEKRFVANGGNVDDIVRPWATCDQGFASIDELCECLAKKAGTYLLDGDAKGTCAADTQAPGLGDASLSVVTINAGMSTGSVLVAKDDKKYRAVTLLGEAYEPGAFGVHNEVEIKGGSLRKVKNRTVAVVKHAHHHTDLNMAGLEACHHDVELETICVLTDGKEPTRCPLSIPMKTSSGCGPGVELDPADMDAETTAMVKQIKDGASEKTTTVSYTIDAEGMLKGVLEDGDKEDVPRGVLGSRSIFPATK